MGIFFPSGEKREKWKEKVEERLPNEAKSAFERGRERGEKRRRTAKSLHLYRVYIKISALDD